MDYPNTVEDYVWTRAVIETQAFRYLKARRHFLCTGPAGVGGSAQQHKGHRA